MKSRRRVNSTVRRLLFFPKMLLRYVTYLVASLGLAASVLAQAPKPLDDIVVTGDVTKILLCDEDESVRFYNVTLKLHVKNIGTRAAIVSAADGMTDFYKLANTLEQLNAKTYNHLGWVTSGPLPDPKTV